MKKFIVEDCFWDLFPKAKIGIVIAKDIENAYGDMDAYADMIQGAQKETLKYLTDDQLSNNKVIQVWREAFQKFKTKKGVRSSIEALMKRASKGNDIGTINPLVDIYNTASLKFALPCGGEDLDTFVGDVRLTFAKGDEDFVTLGSDVSEPPYAEELIYKDEAGAICRCLNWREAVRTMLSEETKNAFLCMESVDPDRDEDFMKALDYLTQNVSNKLGGKCQAYVLDFNKRSIEF